MCGRLGRPDLTWRQLYELQRAAVGGVPVVRDQGVPDLAPSWNVKPTQLLDIAYLDGDHLVSTVARWWFVPHWVRGADQDWKQTTFNARIETASEKPTFRTAWARHCCIIPAIGYYEWTGEKGAKQPWWITTRRNAPALFFAGLYSRRDTGASCTILTRAALPQIAHIHNRTPVILTDDEIGRWLNGEADGDAARDTLGTLVNDRIEAHKVARFKRDDDGPELIEPLAELF